MTSEPGTAEGAAASTTDDVGTDGGAKRRVPNFDDLVFLVITVPPKDS